MRPGIGILAPLMAWMVLAPLPIPAWGQDLPLPGLASSGIEYRPARLVPAWGIPVHDEEAFALSPRDPGECLAVADAGIVVCGTRNGLLLALSTHDGTEVWSRSFPGTLRGRPVLAHGSLFLAGGDGCLHRLAPETGESLWERPICAPSPFVGEPVLQGSRLVAMTLSEQVHLLDAVSRNPIWKFDEAKPRLLASEGVAAPSWVDGDVLAGFSTGLLVRLSGDSGRVLWGVNLGADIQGAPDVDATPVVRDGVAYTASFGRGPVAVRVEDGKVLWRGEEFGAGRALVTEDSVLVGTAEGTMVALRRSDGRLLWRTRLQSRVVGNPVRVGRFVVAAGDRGLWLLDLRTGRPLDRLGMLWGIQGTPECLGSRVFFVGNGGTIQAVDIVSQ